VVPVSREICETSGSNQTAGRCDVRGCQKTKIAAVARKMLDRDRNDMSSSPWDKINAFDDGHSPWL